MIRIVGNDKVRALAWAMPRLGITGTDGWEHFSALFLEKDHDIQAAVFYKQWVPTNSVELHLAAVAGGRWLTRSFLRAAFSYPFEQLGVRRLTALIAADNLPSIRWTEHCGFTLEGRAREAWAPGIDILIYGMMRRECRFLDDKLSKEQKKSRSLSGAEVERSRVDGAKYELSPMD